MFEATNSMNDNLRHSRTPDQTNHNGAGYGLDLEKMNPLGELNFFFGERSSSSEHHLSGQQQRQQQQQPGKRSMDDVLKKLSSKMHISHSPVDETDPFNKDRFAHLSRLVLINPLATIIQLIPLAIHHILYVCNLHVSTYLLISRRINSVRA